MMRALALAGLLACTSGLWADAGEDGGQPAAYLKRGVGARSQGMGNAMAGLADDADALVRNPAALPPKDALQVGMDVAFLGDEQTHQHLMLGKEYKGYGFGLSWAMLRQGLPLERRSKNTPQAEGSFDAAEHVFQVAANAPVWRFQLGAGVKYLQSNIGSETSGGLGLDAGLTYGFGDGFKVGAALLDPFTHVSWSTQREESLPFTVRMAAGWSPKAWPVKLGVEVDKPGDQGVKPRLGVEVLPLQKLLALRLGLDNGAPCLGFGVQASAMGVLASLNYAMFGERTHEFSLGEPAHRLGLTLTLGEPSGPTSATP
jgi:hypothetical protein